MMTESSPVYGEYGGAAGIVRLVQEAATLLNKRVVTMSWAMGAPPEISVVMQEGLLSGPVPQIVVAPRWFEPGEDKDGDSTDAGGG